MPELFYCPVCSQDYKSSLDARQCPEINGYPAKPKFEINQKVLLMRQFEPAQEWQIMKIAYSQPSWISRKPAHQIVYLLCRTNLPGPLTLTTAIEAEMTSI